MKINYKKSLKLVTLLITSMLIATASAAVYYTINMKSKVTVTALTVKFVNGGDTPAGSTVNDAFCSLALKSYPNATLTYDKAINISNTDTNNAHRLRLRHVSITPANGSSDIGNFNFIKFYVIDESGTQKTMFQYASYNTTHWSAMPQPTEYFTIPEGVQWKIKVETLSPATATLDKYCIIEIAIDIQE
jgi:hypothetical protein